MIGIVRGTETATLEEILMLLDAEDDQDRMRKIVVDHHFIENVDDPVQTVLEVRDPNQGRILI